MVSRPGTTGSLKPLRSPHPRQNGSQIRPLRWMFFWANGQDIASSPPTTSSKKRVPSKGYPSPYVENRRAEGEEHKDGRDA